MGIILHSTQYVATANYILSADESTSVLEHGSSKHRQMCIDHLVADLLDYATNEQGFKSVTKAFKETGPDTLARIVKRMCEPAKGSVIAIPLSATLIPPPSSGRRAMIVDLALSVTGSQLIANVLPQVSRLGFLRPRTSHSMFPRPTRINVRCSTNVSGVIS